MFLVEKFFLFIELKFKSIQIIQIGADLSSMQ